MVLSPRPSVCPLTYRQGAKRAQRRFAGRVAVEPQINLRDYRVQALIDWTDLEVRLERPTQFRYLQAAVQAAIGRRCHVRPSGGYSASCHCFTVRIQDPSVAMLATIEDAIVARFGSEAAVNVVGLEISVDFYPRRFSEEAGGTILATLQRHFLPSVVAISKEQEGRPRYAWRRGSAGLQFLDRYDGDGGYGDIPANCTLYFGPRSGPVSWRIYWKDADTRRHDGVTLLSAEESRARVEVTLGSSPLVDLGIASVRDLIRFKFERLTQFFAFRLPMLPSPAPEKEPVHRCIQRWRAAYRYRLFLGAGIWALEEHERRLRDGRKGRRRPPGRRHGRRHRIGRGGYMASYTEMNAAVRQALRSLSARSAESAI